MFSFTVQSKRGSLGAVRSVRPAADSLKNEPKAANSREKPRKEVVASVEGEPPAAVKSPPADERGAGR